MLPAPAGGYLLGHNRDESSSRSRGRPPSRGVRQGRAFLAPTDPDEGGTWIAVTAAGTSFCILNASHADPGRLSSRPPSRGRIVPALLHLDSPGRIEDALRARMPELGRMRGFHLVVVLPRPHGRGGASVTRFRWNGLALERDGHRLPALFVSSGYDQAGAEAARAGQWSLFLDRGGAPDARELESWLAGHEPRRGVLSVCMHGGRAGTVSRTTVRVGPGRISMRYHDGPPCDEGAPETERALARSAPAGSS